MDEKIFRQLKDEALDEGVSLNKKINAILEDYVKFEKPIKEYAITIPKKAFGHICENIDKNVLLESWNISYSKDIQFLFHQKDVSKDIKSMLNFIRDLTLWVNGANKFIIRESDNRFEVLINHEYGETWSTCLEKMIEESIGLFYHNYITSKTFKNVITMDILKQNN